MHCFLRLHAKLLACNFKNQWVGLLHSYLQTHHENVVVASCHQFDRMLLPRTAAAVVEMSCVWPISQLRAAIMSKHLCTDDHLVKDRCNAQTSQQRPKPSVKIADHPKLDTYIKNSNRISKGSCSLIAS